LEQNNITSDFWGSMIHGQFPAVFVNKDNHLVDPPGFILRWRWTKGNSLDSRILPLLAGYEIQDAYWTCIEAYSTFYKKNTRAGLTLVEEDYQYILSNGIKLSGSSLGLPMLIGLAGHINAKPWPKNTLAWGNIRPIRNNSFALYSVDRVTQKLKVGLAYGMKCLIHPPGDDTIKVDANQIVMPSTLEGTLNKIRTLQQSDKFVRL